MMECENSMMFRGHCSIIGCCNIDKPVNVIISSNVDIDSIKMNLVTSGYAVSDSVKRQIPEYYICVNFTWRNESRDISKFSKLLIRSCFKCRRIQDFLYLVFVDIQITPDNGMNKNMIFL